MEDISSLVLSGNISLDEQGERVFLATRGDTRLTVGDHVLSGSHVYRVLADKENLAIFPERVLCGHGAEVSILARVASTEELSLHDQPTSPTFVAERIVLSEDIRPRAFEIAEATQNPRALDNWLLAERQLLGVT
jgi:hypothetical protein